LGARAALAHEALERRGTFLIREDYLDGDVVAEQHPAREIHRAHPTFRERRENLIATVQELTYGEHRSIIANIAKIANIANILEARRTALPHFERPVYLEDRGFGLSNVGNVGNVGNERRQRKILPILFPSPEKNPSIALRTRCLIVPWWIGHSRPGTWSPSLKYSL